MAQRQVLGRRRDLRNAVVVGSAEGRGAISGSRSPVVGRVAFALWVLMDLGSMGRQWLRGHSRA